MVGQNLVQVAGPGMRKRVVRRKPKSTAKRVRNVERKLRSEVRKEEVKWLDTNQNPTALNQTTNLTQLLNGVAQGDEPYQRQGNTITSTSLMVKANVYAFPVGVNLGVPQRVRFMIVWDSQSNGSAPQLNGNTNTNSILDDSVITDLTLAPYNRSNSNRYRMIYDKLIFFPIQIATPGGTTYTYESGNGDSKTGLFILNKKFKLGRLIKYRSNGPNIGDIASNSIYIYIFTNFNTNTNMFATYGTRFNFKDD